MAFFLKGTKLPSSFSIFFLSILLVEFSLTSLTSSPERSNLHLIPPSYCIFKSLDVPIFFFFYILYFTPRYVLFIRTIFTIAALMYLSANCHLCHFRVYFYCLLIMRFFSCLFVYQVMLNWM